MVTTRIGIGMNMKKSMDESWKHWVKENIDLGVPNKTIFNTLKSHNFDLDDITNTMGWSPEEGSFVVQEDTTKPQNAAQVIYDRRELKHERRFIHRAEKIEVENDTLDIYKIDNFMTTHECEVLVKIIKNNMKKSKVSFANKSDEYVDNNIRTSSTCNLHKSHGKLIEDLNERMNAHLGIHVLFGEPMQGQHYDKTQEFKKHTDTFAPNTDEYKKFCANWGQRTWTFMIYLNEPELGGETKFTKVKTLAGDKLSFKPKLGRAVIWNNLYVNGDINSYSLHQGSPVKRGEKTIITKWYRERRS
jgi:prolyl 4-hydroxylase